jgi:type VII secretion protein EccB
MSMQSRRDLYQAHRLMTRRAALALLRGEPDVPDQPLRRLNVAAFSGILVAVIVTVVFFMWGLLGHSGSSLHYQPGTLVIDKQTGTPFVFCKGGSKICPVVNYASARLALGNASLNQQTVSQSELTKFARGPLIGIPGLPQPLPDSNLLFRQPWSICTASVTAAGIGTHPVTILSGGIKTGGEPLGTGALLVRALDQDWVIWDAERMPIQPALIAALTNQTPATVPVVWLNSLPQGPAFAPPAIAGRLDRVASPTGGSARVGQVYAVSAAGSTQYYVLLQRGGLAPVTQTQARLLDTERGTPPQQTLSASQASGHLSSPLPGGALLPSSIPTVTTPAAAVPLCVVYSGRGSRLTRQVDTGGQLPGGGVTTDSPGDVDQVALPSEGGALVAADPGAEPDSGVISYFLVADGRRYALASTSVAGMLGYSLSQAVHLPAGVVDLIPQGPPLNPAAASLPVPSSG